MDELSIAQTSEPPLGSGSVFMLQQVAVEREKLTKGKNWASIADEQMRSVFTMTDRDDKDLLRLVDMYVDDLGEGDP